MVNEEGSREYEDEDTEAYRDYQGSEEYQYHYDGDDYPSYEEDYSEEQVSRENFRCCFNLDWTPSNCASAVYFKRGTSQNENEGLKFKISRCT